jgi:hypothetical protein
LDKTVSLPLLPDGGIKKLKKDFDLCVTGEVSYIFKIQDILFCSHHDTLFSGKIREPFGQNILVLLNEVAAVLSLANI